MDTTELRRGVISLLFILIAIMTADILSSIVLTGTGLSGGVGFPAGFVLYAVLFFAFLAFIGRVTGFRFLDR